MNEMRMKQCSDCNLFKHPFPHYSLKLEAAFGARLAAQLLFLTI